MAWDPAQYLKFAGPRLRPALDLLQRIDVEAPASSTISAPVRAMSPG